VCVDLVENFPAGIASSEPPRIEWDVPRGQIRAVERTGTKVAREAGGALAAGGGEANATSRFSSSRRVRIIMILSCSPPVKTSSPFAPSSFMASCREAGAGLLALQHD